MKKALLAALLLASTTQAQANDLWREHIGCSGYYNIYTLNWSGTWFGSGLIYLELSEYQTSWDFYAGYLPPCGTDSSPIHKMWYRMMVEDPGGGFIPWSQVYVPRQACTPVP